MQPLMEDDAESASSQSATGGVTFEEQVDVLIAASREVGGLTAQVAEQEHRRDAAPAGFLRRECTRELTRRRRELARAERWLVVERSRVLASRRR